MASLRLILGILTLIKMNHIKAFALAKWSSADKIEVIEAEGESGIHQDLNDILTIMKTKTISQF